MEDRPIIRIDKQEIIMSPVEISSQDQIELERILREQFSAKFDSVVVEPLSNRSTFHAEAHFVAVTNHGQKYGIKGVAKVRDVLEALDREYLGGTLAYELNLPNAGRVSKACFSFIQGEEANLIEWLPEPILLGQLEAQSSVVSMQSDHEFFWKYGQWVAFSMIFDIRDRHGGNCVCSKDGKNVVMIDFEDSFIQADVRACFALRAFLSPDPKIGDNQRRLFREGYEMLYVNVQKQFEDLSARFEHSGRSFSYFRPRLNAYKPSLFLDSFTFLMNK